MADVTLESNCLLTIGRKMFAIMTAKTTGRVLVPDIVCMRRPIQTLLGIANLR